MTPLMLTTKRMSAIETKMAIGKLREYQKLVLKMRATVLQMVEHPDATPDGIWAASRKLSATVTNYHRMYDTFAQHGDHQIWTYLGEGRCKL